MPRRQETHDQPMPKPPHLPVFTVDRILIP